MKRLTIVRHGKAVQAGKAHADFERALTDRGERDAAMMGQRLAQQQPRPDGVISSPAKRALTTATIVAHELGFPAERILTEAKIYEADMADLLEVIRGIDNQFADVILVGHNPGFEQLSEYLTGEQLDKLPTSGVVRVEFTVDEWSAVAQGQGKMVLFDSPKNQK